MVKVKTFSREEFTARVTAKGNALLRIVEEEFGITEENKSRLGCGINGDIYIFARSLRAPDIPLVILTTQRRILVDRIYYFRNALNIAEKYEKLFPGDEFTIEKNWG